MRRQILAGASGLLLATFWLGAGPAAACGWNGCGPYGYYAAPPAPVYYVPPPRIYIGLPIFAYPPPTFGYYSGPRYYRGGYYGGPRRHFYGAWRGYGHAHHHRGWRRGHWRR
jgi:hypothetical protein